MPSLLTLLSLRRHSLHRREGLQFWRRAHHRQRLRSFWKWPLLALSLGCGADPALSRALKASQQEREILQEAFNAQQRRLNALEAKVAMMDDQLQQRLLAYRPRRALPVKSLAPRPAAPPISTAMATPTLTQADLPRPVRSARPPRSRVSRARRGPVAPPPIARNAPAIGVSPLPPPPQLEERRAAPPSKEHAGVAQPSAQETSAQEAVTESSQSAGLPAPVSPPSPPSPGEAIQSAIRGLKAQQEGAQSRLQGLLSENSSHPLYDDGLLALGLHLHQRGQRRRALGLFKRLISEDPTGNQVPEALLMIGQVQRELGAVAEGRQTLARLISLFPETPAAERARARLQRP